MNQLSNSQLIGDWGKSEFQLTPIGKSASVAFRVRFVRASGQGGAVWVCERAVIVNVGLQNCEMCSSGRGCVPGIFFVKCIVCVNCYTNRCCM